MTPLRRFGQAIKRLRKAVGLTQAKLAERSELLSATFVSEIERGNKEAGLRTIYRFTQGLSIAPWDVMFLAATSHPLLLELEHTGSSSSATIISPWSWRPDADAPTGVMEPIDRPAAYRSTRRNQARARTLIAVSRTRDGYAAHVPYMPACAAVGPTLEVVVANMREAIADWLSKPPTSVSEPSSYAVLLDFVLW